MQHYSHQRSDQIDTEDDRADGLLLHQLLLETKGG